MNYFCAVPLKMSTIQRATIGFSCVLSDLQTRYQVEKCVSDMVGDVEIWHAENALLAARREMKATKVQMEDLRGQLLALEEEKKAVDQTLAQLRKKATVVREKFVVDISQVLYESRRSHLLQSRARDVEECKARIADLESQLLTSQDTIKSLEKIIEQQGKSDISSSTSTSTSTLHLPHPPSSPMPHERNQANDDAATTATLAIAGASVTSTSNFEESGAASSLAVDMEKEIHEVAKNPINLLADLNDTTLLLVFSFLHTMEVLHAAEVNRFVFKRVGTLFGIESQVVQDDWDKPSSSSSSTTHGAASSNSTTNSSTSSSLTASESTTTAATAAASKSGIITTPNGIGGLQQKLGALGQQPITLASVLGVIANVTGGAVGVASNNSNDGVSLPASSPLPHAGGMDGGSITSPTPVNSNPNTTSATGAFGLTGEMVDSLTKKLTAAEIKAIISLTELLKKQSSQIEASNVEKEDISARLQNAEAVRDFLVDKLKNAELALKASFGEVATLKKQILANDEVISFLDTRGGGA